MMIFLGLLLGGLLGGELSYLYIEYTPRSYGPNAIPIGEALVVLWSTIFGAIAGAILLPVIVSSLRKTARAKMLLGLLVGGLLGGELSYFFIINYMSLYGPNANTVGEEFWVFLCSTIFGAIIGALLPVLISSFDQQGNQAP